MSLLEPTDEELSTARVALTDYVRERAEQVRQELGFSAIATESAPATYPQLRAAFAHSQATGDPLSVSSLFCDDTIYLTPTDNVLFRFFHDVSHVQLGLSFELPDEWELAYWHLHDLTRHGYGLGTLEYRLLRCNLIGQVIVRGVLGRFPKNQGEFTWTCAKYGLDDGLVAEIRRVS